MWCQLPTPKDPFPVINSQLHLAMMMKKKNVSSDGEAKDANSPLHTGVASLTNDPEAHKSDI
jgi:hypothetical protein